MPRAPSRSSTSRLPRHPEIGIGEIKLRAGKWTIKILGGLPDNDLLEGAARCDRAEILSPDEGDYSIELSDVLIQDPSIWRVERVD